MEEQLKRSVTEARGNCRFDSVQGWASWQAVRAGRRGLGLKDQVPGRLGRSFGMSEWRALLYLTRAASAPAWVAGLAANWR